MRSSERTDQKQNVIRNDGKVFHEKYDQNWINIKWEALHVFWCNFNVPIGGDSQEFASELAGYNPDQSHG